MMRRLLLPLSWLYGVILALRNLGFDSGVLQSRTAGVPVISVGNLTAGGTGKTPLVEYLLPLLLAHGRKVAVVSRGYGRRSKGVVVVSRDGRILVNALQGGDEPVQIARKFRSVSVVVGERRVDAAAVAIRECGADVLVLDDGFQHRYLRRDLDIVVMDARRDLTREPMLPAGMRREWLSGLQRADLVALSHAGAAGPPEWSLNLRSDIARRMFSFRSRIVGFASIPDGTPVDVKAQVFAFSGIGDHQAFLGGLRDVGVTVAGDQRFGDHHIFASGDADLIVDHAASSGAGAIVTTEKDMVRLLTHGTIMDRLPSGLPWCYATLAIEVVEGRAILEEAIGQCLRAG